MVVFTPWTLASTTNGFPMLWDSVSQHAINDYCCFLCFVIPKFDFLSQLLYSLGKHKESEKIGVTKPLPNLKSSLPPIHHHFCLNLLRPACGVSHRAPSPLCQFLLKFKNKSCLLFRTSFWYLFYVFPFFSCYVIMLFKIAFKIIV